MLNHYKILTTNVLSWNHTPKLGWVSQSFNVPCGSVATILRLCFVAQFNWEQSSAVLLPQLQLFSCTRETSVAEFFSPSEKYSDLHAIATISTTKLVHTTQFSIIMQAYWKVYGQEIPPPTPITFTTNPQRSSSLKVVPSMRKNSRHNIARIKMRNKCKLTHSNSFSH